MMQKVNGYYNIMIYLSMYFSTILQVQERLSEASLRCRLLLLCVCVCCVYVLRRMYCAITYIYIIIILCFNVKMNYCCQFNFESKKK